MPYETRDVLNNILDGQRMNSRAFWKKSQKSAKREIFKML